MVWIILAVLIVASVTLLIFSWSMLSPAPRAGGTQTFTTQVSPVDGMSMVLVPEGEFTMGSDEGGMAEGPAHRVFLDAYWIDQTEVTNGMFVDFLNEEGDLQEEGVNWFDLGDSNVRIHLTNNRLPWIVDQGMQDYPVTEVTWFGARAYCEWAGRRLPSEAEWEKAARGTDGRTYPWGEELDCSMANYDYCTGGGIKLTRVGSYPAGASPCGALDMIGNVWEFTADWYSSDYYAVSPADNPQGPQAGEVRVVRGGSYQDPQENVHSFSRYWYSPTGNNDYLGFRCAMTP